MIDIIACIGLLLIIVACGVLNRLRGTGVIKHFGTLNIVNKKIEIKFVGNHLYGLFIALILGFATMNYWLGLAVFVAYLVGESKGWGEWVGSLTRVEPWDEVMLQGNYKDEEGKTFPFIYQIANSVCKEQIEGTFEERCKQYRKHATLALTLRGMYWWGLVYGVIGWFELINLYEYIAIVAILGLGFPIACEIGRLVTSKGKLWKLEWSQGWENQELVYGLIQGACLWYVILKVVYE